MAKPAGESVPRAMRPYFDAVTAGTDDFCREWLQSEEYAALCRQLAATLCRKRPSPLLSGNVNTWAAAVVHVIGAQNFLFDKSQTPYVAARDLAAAFRLSPNTVSAKAKVVREAAGIRFLDWHWVLPSRVYDYPGVWSVMVDGWVVDIRTMPLAIQEQAFREGIIPFVPGHPLDEGE